MAEGGGEYKEGVNLNQIMRKTAYIGQNIASFEAFSQIPIVI